MDFNYSTVYKNLVKEAIKLHNNIKDTLASDMLDHEDVVKKCNLMQAVYKAAVDIDEYFNPVSKKKKITNHSVSLTKPNSKTVDNAVDDSLYVTSTQYLTTPRKDIMKSLILKLLKSGVKLTVSNYATVVYKYIPQNQIYTKVRNSIHTAKFELQRDSIIDTNSFGDLMLRTEIYSPSVSKSVDSLKETERTNILNSWNTIIKTGIIPLNGYTDIVLNQAGVTKRDATMKYVVKIRHQLEKEKKITVDRRQRLIIPAEWKEIDTHGYKDA